MGGVNYRALLLRDHHEQLGVVTPPVPLVPPSSSFIAANTNVRWRGVNTSKSSGVI